MIAEFENYLRRQTTLSDDDINRVIAGATLKKLRRNEFLLREGDICRHKIFIAKGLLRFFSVTADGGEHILQFSPEDNWMLDPESYDQQTPTQYYINAVEPSEVLLWAKPEFDGLLVSVPQLKLFAEQLISRSGYNNRQRLLTALSATPEQKYEDFVRTSPELLSRLPLRMIASYLGISLKTLNRVRHDQLLRS
ncbi:Crp/Fnr family transcriptional regulator [Mucilaginibacter sp. JRF]|uniref:Crp/Fnr family transcriptional regulator n=1 Tax=Mucilaginibacter sp. JRF TaxID=2780088 RepID=UPI00187FBD8A|nr:Crp/Fnr family transcriptional regulator [Mucilaginibacter sp. JRF]MBE9585833.1 Crp/Fnr family transcriptional regulator [Mucilaginibacter sp. JRF]